MSREFWENPREFTVSPSDPDSVPSGIQNPYLTLFARIEVSFNGLVEELEDIDGVVVAPFEYYHLTLKQIGEFGEEQIAELISDISSVVMSFDSFSISLEGVDVFPNCVYIPVKNEEEVKRFHQELCSISQLEENGFEGEDYIPHITVAKFTSEDVDVSEVHSVLETYKERDWVDITIDSLHLVKDKPVQKENVVFPPFESLGEFELEEVGEAEKSENN